MMFFMHIVCIFIGSCTPFDPALNTAASLRQTCTLTSSTSPARSISDSNKIHQRLQQDPSATSTRSLSDFKKIHQRLQQDPATISTRHNFDNTYRRLQ